MNYNITYTERSNQRLQVATELMKALIQTGQVTSYLNAQKEYYSDLVVELADVLIEKCETPKEL